MNKLETQPKNRGGRKHRKPLRKNVICSMLLCGRIRFDIICSIDYPEHKKHRYESGRARRQYVCRIRRFFGTAIIPRRYRCKFSADGK